MILYQMFGLLVKSDQFSPLTYYSYSRIDQKSWLRLLSSKTVVQYFLQVQRQLCSTSFKLQVRLTLDYYSPNLDLRWLDKLFSFIDYIVPGERR